MQRDVQPYTLFVYAIRSPYTKESYFRALRKFFDSVGLCIGTIFEERCNAFANKGRQDSSWAFNTILMFLQYQKERVERKEITGGTLLNHVKTIKMFCEITDIVLRWKKITRGLPRARRYAADRTPRIEEIRKITEYPDRRIKPIVYAMASGGFRLGSWDYMRWKHVLPMTNEKGEVTAAKLLIYADEPEEYYNFVTSEAYYALKDRMDFRSSYGEKITGESWLMRDLWKHQT